MLIGFDGEPDHVHLLIDLQPDNNLSNLVSFLKSASSRILRQQFGELRRTGEKQSSGTILNPVAVHP
ncbi:IS200/IS605 family transposase [Synechococcus sp. B60.2]|uniref:IS200/IS605 family transposase n=1 Tax=Synechococcus sp. B60.2 TaxID=2964523 RepID=UPI0039C3C8B8